jgi:hypothetical protein
MNNLLENALKETCDIKYDFYEKNKNLSLRRIILKIENKKYDIMETKEEEPVVQSI